jgi:hypothetical protein
MKKAELPAILVGKPGTAEVLTHNNKLDDDGESLVFCFFIDMQDRRVLVCHGNEHGMWPQSSRWAIEHFNPDVIYCCYPKTMRLNTGDKRIVGNHNSYTSIKRTEIPGKNIVVTLKARK